LLVEAHPPVRDDGETFDLNFERLSGVLRAAAGDSKVAIHWDHLREVLRQAEGVIATVGLEARDPAAQAGEAGIWGRTGGLPGQR
jgi:hypothetical protein